MKERIMRPIALTILLISSVLLAAPPKIIDQFTGKVVGVTDGDTVTVLVNKKTVTVRLDGIDAPESRQSFGTKSKQALSKLVFGKQVTIKKTGEDRYKRTLGVIMLGNVDANAKMVEDGWAWHFKKYNDEERLAKLENKARSAKRGLWAEANPLAPWDYRARQRAGTSKASEPGQKTSYWLNTSSGVRHNNQCEYFENTKRGRLCGPSDGKPCGICGG